MARSRSTFLSNILAQHYGYDNLFEPYHSQITRPIIDNFGIGQIKEKWEAYVKASREITNSLKERDNFVIKVFPDGLYNFWKFDHNLTETITYKELKLNDCLPVIEHYNIKMYTSIYATYRNNHNDFICSILTALKHNQFLFYSQAKAKFYAPKKINLSYTKQQLDYYAFLDFYYHVNLNKLKELNTNVIYLEYDEIPKYVEANFSNIEPKLIDAKFDYRNNILNYDQLGQDYQESRINIKESLKDLFSK